MPYPIVVYATPEDGGYFAVVPDLPGCTAHRMTDEEAVREAQVAMELWREIAREDGDILTRAVPLPRGRRGGLRERSRR